MEIQTTTKEWKKVTVGDIGKYLNGFPFKPSQWGNEGYPIIRIQNLNDKRKKFNYYDGKVPEKYLIRKNDILISWSASLGVYLWDKEYGWLNQHIFKATPNEDAVDRDFFYWVMYSAISGIAEHARGSTMKHVTKLVFDNYELNIPSDRIEQIAVAHVLTTVQNAIAEQEKLITKLNELKRSMMRHLFTHGTNGEKTKMTEIGEVPKSWEIVKLGDVCDVSASSITFKQAEVKTGDVVVLGVKVSDMNILGNEKYLKNTVTTFRFSDTKRLIPPGAIIFPKRGAAIATNKKRISASYSLLDPNLIAIVPKQDLSSDFIFYFFEMFNLSTLTDPGTIPQLNKKDLLPVLLPLPSGDEQQKIVSAISAVENLVDTSKEKLIGYQRLFKTLLHELMSGERRIKL